MLLLRRSKRAFSIIELLIVLAIIGILSAIVVWNYLIGIQRARQKKTIADMRSIAMAWEARAGDKGSYGVSADFVFPPDPVTHAQITAALTPTYMKTIPENDGWGTAFGLGTENEGADVTGTRYGIRSAGRNATFESSYPSPTTTSFDCDIVYSNGAFVVFPEQLQQAH